MAPCAAEGINWERDIRELPSWGCSASGSTSTARCRVLPSMPTTCDNRTGFIERRRVIRAADYIVGCKFFRRVTRGKVGLC